MRSREHRWGNPVAEPPATRAGQCCLRTQGARPECSPHSKHAIQDRTPSAVPSPPSLAGRDGPAFPVTSPVRRGVGCRRRDAPQRPWSGTVPPSDSRRPRGRARHRRPPTPLRDDWDASSADACGASLGRTVETGDHHHRPSALPMTVSRFPSPAGASPTLILHRLPRPLHTAGDGLSHHGQSPMQLASAASPFSFAPPPVPIRCPPRDSCRDHCETVNTGWPSGSSSTSTPRPGPFGTGPRPPTDRGWYPATCSLVQSFMNEAANREAGGTPAAR